jgi:hypothetical protein
MIAELTPEQRWVFVGLILLAGDSSVPGIVFRRKNEDGVRIGYTHPVLADTLGVDETAIVPAIARMIEKNKIAVDELGVITVCNWDKYQSEYERTREAPSRCTKVQRGDVQKYGVDLDVDRDIDVDKEFIEFWDAYDYKVGKTVALGAYRALRRSGVAKAEIARALNGYHDFLRMKKERDNFDQHKMHPATFLRKDRWRDYSDIVYKPRL